MLRIVFDTNIIISGYFWRGAPRHALDLALNGRVILLASDELITELRETLMRTKFDPYFEQSGRTRDELFTEFEGSVASVIPAFVPEGVVRDPKDRHILACAVGGNADAIISGDKDLTDLKQYKGIPIWSAPYFLQQLESSTSETNETDEA